MRSLGIILHAATGWSSFAFWTVLLGVCILVDTVFGPRRRFSAHALMWTWGRLHFLTSPFWRTRVVGTENIGPGPYLVVSNHQSMVDIPNVLGLGLPSRIVARGGIFRAPIIGPFLGLSRQIHADRFMEDCRRALEDGLSVVAFPEGTRSEDGEVGRFRSGAFRLAMETGVPILPVVTDGSRFVAPKDTYMPVQPSVSVLVKALPPVDPADFASADELKRHVRGAIVAELDELRSSTRRSPTPRYETSPTH